MHIYMAVASLWSDKAKCMYQGRKRTVQVLSDRLKADSSSRRVWFHVASLGEFEQARPLIEELRRCEPNTKIVISFFSSSGYNLRCGYDKADAVVYLPIDSSKQVKAFLDILKSDLAIFVKYDLWPYLLTEVKRRGIACILISAIFREGQFCFKPWGRWYLNLLHLFNHIYVQNEHSVKLLLSAGIGNVSLAGDTRFDRVIEIAKSSVNIRELDVLASRFSKIIVAGSTWPRDEEILFASWEVLDNYALVLAPHEYDSDSVATLQNKSPRPLIRLSGLMEMNDEQLLQTHFEGIIIDQYGLLSSIYRYAYMAYIGGGFGRGIHNSIEAAVYGVPILFGPKIEKFREAIDLKCLGGAFVVNSKDDIINILIGALSEDDEYTMLRERILGYVFEQQGATQIILNNILEESYDKRG